MSNDNQYEDLLKNVLERVIQNNNQIRPGTPMAELKSAIEGALISLPPLEFEEFGQAIQDTEAAQQLVKQAPDIIGWNADRLIEWIEELSRRQSDH